jgi:hypothetical protein
MCTNIGRGEVLRVDFWVKNGLLSSQTCYFWKMILDVSEL